MTRAFALLALSVALVCSCSRSESKPRPRKSFDGKATAELVHRPEVAALVDALAAEREIQSSSIGDGGSPSAVYAKFEALAKAATDDEMVALLTHASPVVRGYAAQHVGDAVPARVGEVVQLADDETVVLTLNGCSHGMDSVGAIVRRTLCNSPLAGAGAALIAVHERHGPEAAAALSCAAPTQPRLAGELAARALRAGKLSPANQAAYLGVLAVAPAPDPAEGCALARAGAESADAGVLIAAAQALGRCDAAASLGLLERLAAGKDIVVARHAKVSLFLLVPERRDAFVGDPEVAREVCDRLGEELRSLDGAKTRAALVESLALAYPDKLGSPFRGAVAAPETTAAARRIAAKLDPTKAAFSHPTARASVIAYLARIHDDASLPELRRSLASGSPEEVVSALGGIEAMRDNESRAAVETLTHDTHREVAQAARRALAAL